jgi:N-acetylmuramoyl-L-alanine amidase
MTEPKIIQCFIPRGAANRPGYLMVPEYFTVHETGNKSIGANALMHAIFLKSREAAAKPVSWHYTVDDRRIVQHLPLNESGWHSGDGRNGPGNRTTIGIEICVNRDGNLRQAYLNAAWLIAKLTREGLISPGREKTHNWWSGKDCPHLLRLNRERELGWEWFRGMVWKYLSEAA